VATITEMFRVGGIWMYLILLLSLLVYPLFLYAAVIFGTSFLGKPARRKNRLTAGAIALGGALVLLLVGALGWYMGNADLQAALAHASPENAERMRARGAELALYPIQFAAVAAALPGVGGLIFLLTGVFSAADDPQEGASG
jgi:hypothetical protein